MARPDDGTPPAVLPLFGEREIGARVATLAAEIARGMATDPMVVAILRGSFVFAADLIRALQRVGMRPQVDFLTLSSYGDRATGRAIEVLRELADDPRERQVLLIDDTPGSSPRALRSPSQRRAARSEPGCAMRAMIEPTAAALIDAPIPSSSNSVRSPSCSIAHNPTCSTPTERGRISSRESTSTCWTSRAWLADEAGVTVRRLNSCSPTSSCRVSTASPWH